MFVQVIKGQVSDSDAAEVRSAMNRWMQDLRPDAIGWLGTTAGVTGDGTCFALARFQSHDAAKRNSERPEQDQWWTETARLFSGDVTFQETEDVVTWMGGGSDEAGFVQVMEGRVLDRERADALVKEMEADMGDQRPDILGGLTAYMADGTYVDVVYFTSEAAAREGEKEMPPEAMEQMNQTWEVTAFHDLTDPWLYSG
jgi:hypothetical protein